MSLSNRAYQGENDLIMMQNALAHWQTLTDMQMYCHIGDIPHRLYNGMRGRVQLSDYVRLWFDDDTCIGFVMGYPIWRAFDNFIHPDYIEHAPEMLRWGTKTIRNYADANGDADKPVVTDCYAPFDPRQRFLDELGYINKGVYGITRKRSLQTSVPNRHLSDGYTMRGSTLSDAEQLAIVHSSAFDSKWTTEIYRDEVMLKPGYIANNERIVVASDGTVVGFCVMWLDEMNKLASFEPVGVHKDYQGKGIGKAMMCEVMRWLRDEKGMTHAMIGADAKNAISNGLYESFGFEKTQELLDYQLIPEGKSE